MRRRLLPGVTLLLFTIASCPSRAPAQAQSLAAIIGDHAKKHAFSGTVLVQHRNRKIYHESFGFAERAFNAPVANDTKFRIASITKAFTAALILQLHEEGKLDLRAPIKAYLPDYSGEGAERVTVHNLLNHTSGIENFDTIKSYEDAVKHGIEVYQLPHTTTELLTKYASGKLVNEVGKVFDYNNADYVILGKIIERITGKSYDATLKERILEPLRMPDSGMLYQQDVVPKLASTYFRPDSTAPLINDLPVYTQNWYAAGGMYSTAADLLEFANALYGSKLLKPASLSQMLTPGLDDYGYGLWIASADIGGGKHRFAQRPGSIMGANTLLLRYLDDDLTIVILGNTNTTDIDRFGFLIGRTILK
jgi:D-alanyl-D-alanine carboxypeptidase